MEKLDDVTRKPTDNKVLNTAAPSKVGRKKHKCGLCDASFGRSFDLKMHIRIHTGEKPHKCDVCGASFIASGQLKKHIRSHTGEKPYKCTLCDSSFVKSCKLKIHMRVHTGEKPYKCTICEASFINSCKLKIHNRIHTGEKPYKCTFCDGAFSHSSSYKNHIRTHTGEKPYKCTMCDASFMNSCHLKKHITIHAEVQLYKCDLCAATFTQPQLLKRHMRIHTGERPHKCTLCDATFAESHELMTHMKVHTGDKPHKCTQCNASFSQSGALKNHMRIHTGEKPYKCNICGATFSFSRGMSKHMESHRGAETSWWMIQERTNKSSKEEADDDYSYREGSLNAVAESSTPYESELVGPVVQKLKEEIQMALCNQTLSQGTMFPGKVEPDEDGSCGKVSLEGNVENSSHDENEHLGASFVQVMLKEEPEISICNKSLPQGNVPPVEVDLDENNYPCNESHGEGGLDGVESSHREHELVDSSFVQVVLKEEPEMRIYNEALHQGTMLPVKEEPDEDECYYNESCEGSFDGIVESSSHGSEHVGPPFVQVMVKEEPE